MDREDQFEWLCYREQSDKSSSFTLHFDASSRCIWWGSWDFWTDPAEFKQHPDRIMWYSCRDWARPSEAQPQFFWRARPQATGGGNTHTNSTVEGRIRPIGAPLQAGKWSRKPPAAVVGHEDCSGKPQDLTWQQEARSPAEDDKTDCGSSIGDDDGGRVREPSSLDPLSEASDRDELPQLELNPCQQPPAIEADRQTLAAHDSFEEELARRWLERFHYTVISV